MLTNLNHVENLRLKFYILMQYNTVLSYHLISYSMLYKWKFSHLYHSIFPLTQIRNSTFNSSLYGLSNVRWPDLFLFQSYILWGWGNNMDNVLKLSMSLLDILRSHSANWSVRFDLCTQVLYLSKYGIFLLYFIDHFPWALVTANCQLRRLNLLQELVSQWSLLTFSRKG